MIKYIVIAILLFTGCTPEKETPIDKQNRLNGFTFRTSSATVAMPHYVKEYSVIDETCVRLDGKAYCGNISIYKLFSNGSRRIR